MTSFDSRKTMAIAVVVGSLLVIALWSIFRRWLHRITLRRRFARAATGELRAESLLVERGYRVIARQAARQWHIAINGTSARVDLRVDYLVEKRGRRFVVEVKTGRFAPRLDNAITRRQLLEYHIAYGSDGALLVNPEQRRIHEIEFNVNRSAASPRVRAIVLIAIGVAIGLALGHYDFFLPLRR